MISRSGRSTMTLGTLLLGSLWASPLAVPLAAQTADRLSVMDVFQLETVTDPQISPDGSRIVYVRQFADVMTDQRYSNLWIINFDGSGHRAVTTGKYSDASPRWSPDGTRLVYTSTRDGSPQIYLRWMETGETAKLTNLQNAPGGLAWSPDGTQIAFSALVPRKPRGIIDMPAAPEGAEWAPPARVFDRLVYRFDGVGELEPGFAHVFVVPVDGGTPRQITSGDFHHGGGPGRGAGTPVWKPDGKSILIAADRRAGDANLERDTEIHEFSVPDGRVRQVTDRRGPDGSPAVSPDGRYLAFVGYDDRFQGYQVTKLYVSERGGTPRVLLDELDRDVANPTWAPDGSGIFFLFDDKGNTKLGFVPLRGQMREIAASVGSGESAYSGGGAVTVARNGRLAFTRSGPHTPGDLAVTGAQSPAARVLTAVNADLLGQRRLGEVEEIWYPSSKDGRQVQGWIIKPPNFDPARKYPLILEIHGGPFANYGDRFDIEKQVWAANGYVVLYTNPRGSTSYGEEFGNLIHHAYPGDDFHDLDSGVDALIARGYVDPERLYVTGGSGGGVLTAWMIGRTDRFRAAVAAYPVINWYSFNLTSDIPMVNRYWFPGAPWEHAEHYAQRSVISLAPKVKTPTLIITGEEDYRTPMSESEQYYQALKLNGVDAVLVKVPGEPHGIRRRPSHHVAKILFIQNWFDQHRGGSTTDR